jgi:hypothetical protein
VFIGPDDREPSVAPLRPSASVRGYSDDIALHPEKLGAEKSPEPSAPAPRDDTRPMPADSIKPPPPYDQGAGARDLDIRRQKRRIEQAELSLIAAKNQLLPRWNVNSLQTLAGGQFQEWQLGIQSTLTIGLRRQLATVRHCELQLARARAILQDLELTIPR